MTSGENYAVFRECLSNAIVARSENSASSSGSALLVESVVAVFTSLRSVRLSFGFRRVGFSSERATMAFNDVR
jgi:hypothetical protein